MHARCTPALFALLLAGATMAGCGDDDAPGGAAGAPGGVGGTTSGGGSSGGAGATSGGGAASGGAGSGSGGDVAGGGTTSGGGAGTGGAPASGGAGGGGDLPRPFKGVANSECGDLGRLNAAWWYNWTLGPGGCTHDEFVPMISGKNEKTTAAVSAALDTLVNAGYRTVLGFNEPNKADQANLTVAQVLELWPALTANPDVRVGSPATSADARAWFDEFMAEVDARQLRVDFVAIHWYGWNAGSCEGTNELENHIAWAESFNRPIWITEWGCMNQSNPNAEVVTAFYSAALEMFQEHPLLERYAWYPWNTHNELVDGDARLTALGVAFQAAPALR